MLILRMSICFIVLMILMLINQIHIIQLNSYNLDQQIIWYKKNIPLFLLNIVMLISSIITFELNFYPTHMITVICMIGILIENLPRKKKKKLVFTKRIKRLIFISAILLFIFFIPTIINKNVVSLKYGYYGTAITPFVIFIAFLITLPIENQFRRIFMNKAKKIIDENKNLYVIGITGSYGKTSVKYFLNSILNEKYRTCMTPESYNTSMGATLTIENNLKSYDEIFICEMGARRIGDIKEICDITSPNAGIITDVGAMHLDTFKTIENVAKCKMELAESIYNNRDIKRFKNFVLVNGDNPYIMNIIKKLNDEKNKNDENAPFYITYGKNHNNNYYYDNVEVNENGSTFDFCYKKSTSETDNDSIVKISFETKLLGEHNIMNLVAAIVMANMFYVEKNEQELNNKNMSNIVRIVKNISPVEHRLFLSKIDNDNLLIDDAFNSNFKGATNAINVLNSFNGYKKVIITPGMVELGDKQKEINEEFAKYASENLDFALVVGNTNKESLMKGFSTKLNDESCLYFSKFNEAFLYAKNNIKGKKVILLENDLPDNY